MHIPLRFPPAEQLNNLSVHAKMSQNSSSETSGHVSKNTIILDDVDGL